MATGIYIKIFSFLFLISFAQASLASKPFIFPKIKNQGNNIESLTPENWTVIDISYGDLNSDSLADVAFILEYDKAIDENRTYGDNHSEIIKEKQKPRILVICFKNPSNNTFEVSTQTNDFILRSEEGGKLGDPLLKMEIKDQQLYLRFKGGSEWRWESGYTFKFQNNDWYLTYAINLYYNSSNGSMTERIFDFVNRQLFTTTGNLHQREAANYKTSEVLFFNQMRTFKTFKKPWAWQIMPDVFL